LKTPRLEAHSRAPRLQDHKLKAPEIPVEAQEKSEKSGSSRLGTTSLAVPVPVPDLRNYQTASSRIKELPNCQFQN
jgi:hypothetical protein